MGDESVAPQVAAHQDRIREFHSRLRRFYYPYMFNDIPFRVADFAKDPRWQPADRRSGLPRTP